MKAIGTPMGLILSFDSRKEIEGVIEHLQTYLGWADTENVDPPFLYALYDDRIPAGEMDKLMDELKWPTPTGDGGAK